MSWFSKKEERSNFDQMPQLPELPDSPNTNFILQESPIEKISLPEIRNPFQPPKTIQQPKIKEYSDEDFKPIMNEPKSGMQRSKFTSPDSPEILEKPIENFGIAKIKEQVYQPPRETEMAKMQSSFKPMAKNFAKKEDAIYIKLEKFQLTMEAFRDIKNKVREIEDLLAKTKEIKAREEKELEEWEREIEVIKLKLDSINKEISGSESY